MSDHNDQSTTAAFPAFAADAPGGAVHLRVLATTDIHMQVTAHDYFTDRPAEGMGLSRVAQLAAAARAEAPNTLAIDAGDFLQGNPMGDLYVEAPWPGGVHPMIAAMNAFGIEAATIGNHDFNFGVEHLERALAGAGFPVVCANVATAPCGPDPLEDKLLLPATDILERTYVDGAGTVHPIRIGVIGVCPPQILHWDERLLAGRLDARDMVEAVEARVPHLRAAGADLVLAICHTGIDPGPRRPKMEHASLHIAGIEGVDLVIAGHQHKLFPGPDFPASGGIDPAGGTLAGTPAVMSGFWGTHLGVIDLDLRQTSEGWRVEASRSELRPVATYDQGRPRPLTTDAPHILEAVATAHAQTLAAIRRPVGTLAAPLTSYFALVADDPTVHLVAKAMAEPIATALAGTSAADLPRVTMSSPFKAGGNAGAYYYTDLAPGALAAKDISDLYQYPNTATALLMTGAQITDWLERSAGIFRQVSPGAQDAPLIDPGFATYHFDVCVGLTYTIDVSQPCAFADTGQRLGPNARIRDLAHKGVPVAPDDRFVVITNSYRAGGGGDFPWTRTAERLVELSHPNRDLVEAWIAAQGTYTPHAAPGWDFAPLPGTTAVFDTGPGAARHLEHATRRKLEEVGPREDGFLRFRLYL